MARRRGSVLTGSIVAVLVVIIAATALAAVWQGTWSGPGLDNRLRRVRFVVNKNDVVKDFVAKKLKIFCHTQEGDFSYRASFAVKDMDAISNDGVFKLEAPVTDGNGTIKVRGESKDLGSKFRGAVRVIGDYLVDGVDYGDCNTAGGVPWKAK